MSLNKKLPYRQSIRLKGYDYSQPGFYFITICTKNRAHVFGKINNGVMHLNEYGRVAKKEWIRTEGLRFNVIIDAYIIMPNHMHGIIEISHYGPQPVWAYRDMPVRKSFQSPSKNLGAIIRGFKSTVTKQINIKKGTPGSPLWHRNYYEHIIRNEDSLHNIREYIKHNPRKWDQDRFFK